MPDAHSVLVAEILAAYGALPAMRLWPNKTMGLWAGKKVGSMRGGNIVLANARMVKVGLAPGSPDLVGFAPGGKFLGIEVKTGKAVARPNQRRFIELLNDKDCIAGVVRSIEDVEALLRRSR